MCDNHSVWRAAPSRAEWRGLSNEWKTEEFLQPRCEPVISAVADTKSRDSPLHDWPRTARPLLSNPFLICLLGENQMTGGADRAAGPNQGSWVSVSNPSSDECFEDEGWIQTWQLFSYSRTQAVRSECHTEIKHFGNTTNMRKHISRWHHELMLAWGLSTKELTDQEKQVLFYVVNVEQITWIMFIFIWLQTSECDWIVRAGLSFFELLYFLAPETEQSERATGLNELCRCSEILYNPVRLSCLMFLCLLHLFLLRWFSEPLIKTLLHQRQLLHQYFTFFLSFFQLAEILWENWTELFLIPVLAVFSVTFPLTDLGLSLLPPL